MGLGVLQGTGTTSAPELAACPGGTHRTSAPIASCQDEVSHASLPALFASRG